jgi:hypothetical protein
VLIADNSFDESIKCFLKNNNNSTFYHLPEYLNILAEESKQSVLKILCLNKEHRIFGYLPLITTKGFPFNIGAPFSSKRLSSLPRTPVCGPIYESETVLNLLLDFAIELTKSRERFILQLKAFENLSEYSKKIYSNFWRKSFLKELPPKGEKIKYKNHQIERDVLRIIRKSERSNLKFITANSIKDLQIWYKLYLQNARFHSVPPRKFLFFKELWNKFFEKGLLNLNLIIKEEFRIQKPIIGSLSFKYKETVLGAFKGRDFRYHTKINDDILHHYEFLKAQDEGYKFFDLGEVASDDVGLQKYKQKWGVIESSIYHNYFFNDLYKSNIVSIKGQNNSFASRIWKLLPIELTAFIGEKINQYL